MTKFSTSIVAASARRYAILALVPVAAAVAIGLVLLRIRFQPPTLAPYVGEGTGGAAVTVAAHGWFEITIRPTASVRGAVGARAFLLRGTEVRPWDPPFTVSRDGTVHITGPVDDLFAGVPPGSWEIAVAVGRPEVLPTAPYDVLRANGHDVEAAGWHLVLERIRLESGSGDSSRGPARRDGSTPAEHDRAGARGDAGTPDGELDAHGMPQAP